MPYFGLQQDFMYVCNVFCLFLCLFINCPRFNPLKLQQQTLSATVVPDSCLGKKNDSLNQLAD